MIWSLRKMRFDHLLWLVVVLTSLEERGCKRGKCCIIDKPGMCKTLCGNKRRLVSACSGSPCPSLFCSSTRTPGQLWCWERNVSKKETLVNGFFKYSGGSGKSRSSLVGEGRSPGLQMRKWQILYKYLAFTAVTDKVYFWYTDQHHTRYLEGGDSARLIFVGS